MRTTPTHNQKSFLFIFRQCGFQYMLIDLVEAPPPVLAYYCAHQHLHNIPVTLNRLTSQQLNSFKSSYPDIQRFYTSDQMVIILSLPNTCTCMYSLSGRARKILKLIEGLEYSIIGDFKHKWATIQNNNLICFIFLCCQTLKYWIINLLLVDLSRYS